MVKLSRNASRYVMKAIGIFLILPIFAVGCIVLRIFSAEYGKYPLLMALEYFFFMSFGILCLIFLVILAIIGIGFYRDEF